jgi:hypothetical protein
MSDEKQVTHHVPHVLSHRFVHHTAMLLPSIIIALWGFKIKAKDRKR